MSLINHSIPNLFNGISQQSASIRQPAQAEFQENAYSSIVDGLHKRHPTNHLAKLSNSVTGGVFVHVMNRDGVEKYVMTIHDGTLKVWDLEGTPKTVTVESGSSYITVSNPETNLTAITIADVTFIVNRTKIATRASTPVAKTVSTYSAYNKLPATGVAGTTYKVAGDPDNQWTSYYCMWTNGAYVETTGVTGGNSFDATTMPHQLVRNADGTFTLKQIEWDDRLVGDEITNEAPSFIGNTIQDMFFFRNRLGFLSNENVIFSRSGEFFNFWVETVTQVLDTDPIDVAVSHVKVSNLKHAIPFNKNLILFSELTQFTLTATDVLTPKTVAVQASTEFECSKNAKPTVVGANVYFAVDKGDFSAIREYYVSPYTNAYDADDVTAHVPRYVPGDLSRLVATSNDDVLFCLSPREPNRLYVYKFYWKGEEKPQSAWSHWSFAEDTSVLNMEIMGTKLYLVIKKPDGIYLEYVDLQVGLVEDDLEFQVFLDRKVKLTGVHDPVEDKTTWTLPYTEEGVQVVLGGSFTGRKGALVTTAQPTGTTITAFGDLSGGVVYVGIPYTMRYRFSPQFVKDKNGSSISGARLKLRNFRVIYNKSGYFRTEVTPLVRETTEKVFSGKILGAGLLIGTANIVSGTFQFPVMTDGATGKVELVNDSYLPSYFQSAEWDGLFITRAQRM